MQPSLNKLLAFVVALSLTGNGGCMPLPKREGFSWPWSPEKDDAVGITTPVMRIDAMKQMQAEAAKKTPEERERISSDLARQIQGETDPLVRRHIIRTLGYYPTPIAGVVLKAAINDADSDVRIAACAAWGRRGGAEAVEVLTGVLSTDTDTDVRLAAARAIGATHQASAVAPLAEALTDSNPAIQHRIVLSLREVSGKDFGTNITSWKAYAKGEAVEEPPVSMVQRLKQIF